MALELLETAFELTHIDAARRSIVDAAAEIIAEEIRQRPDKLESILDGL